mmetsp:Transcript_4176/g.15504  ORF Transcript_4176/g.15504 Transcript_4176/m.15504 type:complete len:662 (-) Transcript_4176:1650-3635(-)
MSEFTGPDGKPWVPPTADDLIAKGSAAVKTEYLRPVPPLADTNANVVDDDKAEAGKRGDGGVDKKRTGKSRRALAREKKQARESGADLCSAFSKGACTFGDKCRYSHNVESYLRAKQPDLPGACPFIAAGKEKCPHGVMCRYLGTHPPVPDTEENKLLPALTPQTTAELKERNAAAGVNEGVLELPVPESPGGAFGPDDEINQFCGWLKVRLRKGQVRFDKADAVLKELGVESSWRYGKEGDEKLRKKWEKKDVVDPGEGGGDETREDDDDGGGKRSKIDPDNTAEGVDVKLRPAEKKTIDFRGKLYLAPLTTTGNLPFRRICKRYGVDITCGEMAMVTNLLQGQPAEWALLRRHPSEDIFGAQVCGGYSDSMSRCMQLLEDEIVSKGGLDFIDINMGCPIDLVCNKGAGSMLLEKPARMEQLVRASAPLLSCPLTLKTRMGYFDNKRVAHEIIPKMVDWGLAGMTLHGRSRQQRYSRLADWDYINQCARASPIQLIGNGDVFSYHDYVKNVEGQGVATCMIARGALIKPWIFTEIKERRDWDISATERLDMLKDYAAFGLEHWGADARGVANTRRFLLEWLSFLHRYVPVGLLERMPVGIHQRPPNYVGRSDLETLLSSPNSEDWVKITTMLLGPTPDNFSFQPKHKSNAYSKESDQVQG